MCLNRIKIFNRYTGEFLYVDCGHCQECFVKKASFQCSRIINSWESGFNYYFVTLTYSNKFVPYVLHQSLLHDDSIIRVYRGNSELDSSFRFDSKEQYFEVLKSLPDVPFLRNHYVFGAVGVLLWNDVVKFLKRLRKNGYSFSYYAVSEYGETFFRPHFHVLFKTKHDEQTFYNAVTSCWSFCNWDKVPRGFEVAISPQKYLSLYLSSTINLSPFYKISHFRPKKSHSLHFGVSSDEFSLFNVFSAAEKHNLTYYNPQIKNSSSSFGSFVPYPSFVINRYFPKFKGFGKLSFVDFLFFAKCVSQHDKRNAVIEYFPPVNKKEEILPLYSCCSQGLRYHSILRRLRLCPSDIKDIINKVNRCYLYAKDLHVDFDYYLQTWYNVYIIVFSQSLKNSLLMQSSFKNYYFNVHDFVQNRVRAPTLLNEFESLDNIEDISSISDSDITSYISRKRKFFKYNKNKKIKTHLL